MIIESKPMLETLILMSEAFVAKLEHERESLFLDPLDPDEKILDVNAMIDIAASFKDAAENELRNKHQSVIA